jgi:multimeric flavodoxin WrbA
MQKKVLVFNGAMRSDGNTDGLLSELIKAREDCEVISRENCVINPCFNCGVCLTDKKCHLQDDMDRVYALTDEAEKVVIASPVYFGLITGFLLDVLSRFQCFFGFDRKVLPLLGKEKEGAIILTAGGGGNTDNALKTAELFAKMLNVRKLKIITSFNTDKVSAVNDKKAMEELSALRGSWFGVDV